MSDDQRHPNCAGVVTSDQCPKPLPKRNGRYLKIKTSLPPESIKMTVSIVKKVASTLTAKGGQIGTVTPPLKTNNKEPVHQIDTDVWNAPKECFFIGNGVTHPEKMSEQAKMLCRADPGYLAKYLDMQTGLASGATANSFKKHKHLAHLGTWWHTRKARAEDTAQWGEPSPEFMVWPGLCWYLGPNPAPGKLSIDRIDPTKPYVWGNLRWADRATQAANQRRNRKNVWNDIALTDKELASKLAALKINTNHLAIKAMRYRIKKAMGKDGTPEAIHAELLKRLKVPTITQKSGDPIQDEPFMDGLGIDWEKEKQAKPWLSNIGFQLQHVAHLEKEILDELAYLHKVNPQHILVEGLEIRLTAIRDFSRHLKNRLQQLHDKKAWKLHDGINPHATSTPATPAGFHHKPAPEPVPPAPPAPIPAPEPQKMTVAGDAEITALLWHLDGVYPTYEEAFEAYHAGAHSKG